MKDCERDGYPMMSYIKKQQEIYGIPTPVPPTPTDKYLIEEDSWESYSRTNKRAEERLERMKREGKLP